ncbi:MAG: hypothetical protein IPO95_14560 [Rhodanobacteraceae bacterium]|jgi:hypothetical protein|nr:hypothetical protein [Rhodanobacteraceae bacterium]MBL0042652.1 hypothetical protein [Xanthomonadales bacterium]MBP6079331.1 hypothetical protein [Xanthomonadales bacterium]MBP7623188.1 hypothetical protein [Xanthomonadales bacterium]
MNSLLHRWICLWIRCCWVVLAVSPAAARAGDEPLRVVFVGNSYTYTNDLPMLFRALVHSQNPNRDVETEAFVTPGGFLNERWREGVVQRYLKANRVDVLVLQEAGGWLRCAEHPSLRSTFACTDSLRTHKRFAEFAAKLGVRSVVLGTWGVDLREQLTISRVTRRLSKAIGALPADTGEAMTALRKLDPDVALFTDRTLHPTPEVSMLAAIMLYTRIDGWLPEARAVVPGQPLISVTALPDARLPLSMQYSTLPRSEFAGFSAERMAVLRAAAERALGNQAH